MQVIHTSLRLLSFQNSDRKTLAVSYTADDNDEKTNLDFLWSSDDFHPDTGKQEADVLSKLFPRTYQEEALVDIEHIVTLLFQLTISIQNPNPRDEPEELTEVDVSSWKQIDISYVQENFPNAPQYLIKRLGQANTKRRQILKYMELYHQNAIREPKASIEVRNMVVEETIGPELQAVLSAPGDHWRLHRLNVQPPGDESHNPHTLFQCPFCYFSETSFNWL